MIECAVCCSDRLKLAVDLPRLPLTALYSRQPTTLQREGYDQQLAVCSLCGHAQMAQQMAPFLLYGNEYSFRTSTSATAKRGTDFFVASLEEFAGSRRFSCVLDWGCNDLYLLRQLGNRADIRIGFDPIWKDREHEQTDPGIQVIGTTIEEVDFSRTFPIPPDLIVCRHTVEHVAAPRRILHQLMELAAPHALFVFETPGFDALVRKYRFDQLFHQHLHYFNLSTFRRLIGEVGGEYVGFRENYHDWGSLLVAFRKPSRRPTGRQDIDPGPFTLPEIRSRYQAFRAHVSGLGRVLASFEGGGPLYGYGAAQMLPILAYHLETDFSSLTAILDDDPLRDGWYYQNLTPPIRYSGAVADLREATVLVTAVDNAQCIIPKLFVGRPRHILLPFNLL